jgi:predicted ATPase with chaperone activity
MSALPLEMHPPVLPEAGPPPPETLADTGLGEAAILGLILKLLYIQGARTGEQIAGVLRLPFAFVDDQLLTLQQRRFAEVRGTSGPSRAGYTFDLGEAGRSHARELLDACQYVGPAPVPVDQYRAWVARHGVGEVNVTRECLIDGFQDVVLHGDVLDALGPAVNSARSLFLYGESGNGKTLIADAISALLGGEIFVPYAIDVDGQIITVFDPVHHQLYEEPDGDLDPLGADRVWKRGWHDYDRRFARVKRPVVIAGGELTLDQLDLRYDAFTKSYQAPFQVKANGGVLIIDDFGRQRMPPRELLNRWIVPLERRIDYLTLHTGGKVPVPFDCLLIFATNLDPGELVEEAFLRRIHYKIRVPDPTPAQYAELFRRCCLACAVPFEPAAVEHVYQAYYGPYHIAPRSCHPRDIINHLCDTARYLEVEATLSTALLDRACASYFLDVSRERLTT